MAAIEPVTIVAKCARLNHSAVAELNSDVANAAFLPVDSSRLIPFRCGAFDDQPAAIIHGLKQAF